MMFYGPKELLQPSRSSFATSAKVPLIVFGHGQALGADAYELTFIHLARKGYAVLHPQYDTGFFDQNWRRMGQDYARLSLLALTNYADRLDFSKIVFSGHSKGAYVALVSASRPDLSQGLRPTALLLFNPAGYDKDSIKNVPKQIPSTVVWSEDDGVIKEGLIQEIFQALPSTTKQYLRVSGYRTTSPVLPADHFFTLTKDTLVGGRDGINPLHYFGTWKWLIGAIENSEFLYGPQATETGLPNFNHGVIRSWP
jgi:acetyl esterase/lipase